MLAGHIISQDKNEIPQSLSQLIRPYNEILAKVMGAEQEQKWCGHFAGSILKGREHVLMPFPLPFWLLPSGHAGAEAAVLMNKVTAMW